MHAKQALYQLSYIPAQINKLYFGVSLDDG